eukprot:TRINITY_DN67210_c2_g1_i2.p2 TRINITY_DN67210_c2_g1~~TRINITY_DN67210_c2_g1_i2.p2  ORF type:complete len:116 (-),score=10.63 TRINITY_DN67210_c2_g1_i2:247-594(-)
MDEATFLGLDTLLNQLRRTVVKPKWTGGEGSPGDWVGVEVTEQDGGTTRFQWKYPTSEVSYMVDTTVTSVQCGSTTEWFILFESTTEHALTAQLKRYHLAMMRRGKARAKQASLK